MSYQVNPKNQNELKRKIQEKVKEAKDNNQTRTIKHNRQDYELTRIRIDRDWLYYNIQNDRTLTDIEEFIGSNGLSEDYFNEENSFNHEQQTNYHSIISSYVKTQMVKTFQRTLDQRDEIYITHEGLVANGNTRLACFRVEPLTFLALNSCSCLMSEPLRSSSLVSAQNFRAHLKVACSLG